jgi:hypothetical protein
VVLTTPKPDKSLDAYRVLAKDPVMVFLELCPRVNPTAADLAAMATNALPSIPIRSQASDFKRVLVLRHRELDCLKRHGRDLLRPVASDGAETRAGQRELVRLDLSACGAD